MKFEQKTTTFNSDLNGIVKRKLLNTLLLECVRCTIRFLYGFSDLLEMVWGYCCFLQFFFAFDFIIFGFSKFSKFVWILKMHFDRDINREKFSYVVLFCWAFYFRSIFFSQFSLKNYVLTTKYLAIFFNFVWWKETWDLNSHCYDGNLIISLAFRFF